MTRSANTSRIVCSANSTERMRFYLHTYDDIVDKPELEITYNDDEANFSGSILVKDLGSLKEIADFVNSALDAVRASY